MGEIIAETVEVGRFLAEVVHEGDRYVVRVTSQQRFESRGEAFECAVRMAEQFADPGEFSRVSDELNRRLTLWKEVDRDPEDADGEEEP